MDCKYERGWMLGRIHGQDVEQTCVGLKHGYQRIWGRRK